MRPTLSLLPPGRRLRKAELGVVMRPRRGPPVAAAVAGSGIARAQRGYSSNYFATTGP